jgi:hypothetical protein
MNFIRTNNNEFTVLIDNKPYMFTKSHMHYDDLVNSIKENDQDAFLEKFDTVKAVEVWSKGNFKIEDGVVKYKDRELAEVLTQRLLSLIDEGFPVDPLLKFIENLYENPSFNSITQLYSFLENENLPITEDGCFVGYKCVMSTEDGLTDHYTRTFNNDIGQTVSMPRNEVNDDLTKECSTGLHVGSIEYVRKQYQEKESSKFILVKVNPANVVSVPISYASGKLRCCSYEVLAEYKLPLEQAVYRPEAEETIDLDDDDDDDDWGPYADDSDEDENEDDSDESSFGDFY